MQTTKRNYLGAYGCIFQGLNSQAPKVNSLTLPGDSRAMVTMSIAHGAESDHDYDRDDVRRGSPQLTLAFVCAPVCANQHSKREHFSIFVACFHPILAPRERRRSVGERNGWTTQQDLAEPHHVVMLPSNAEPRRQRVSS